MNIAFVGKAGAGKTTASELMMQLRPELFTCASFATAVRETAVWIWGPSARDDRDTIQALGAAVREIDPDAWVHLWLHAVDIVGGDIVNDDLRFENEWWTAKGVGFVIVRVVADRALRIDRLKASGKWQNEAQLDDVSETAVDHLTADYTIFNAGTKIALVEALADILNKEAKRS
jgi:dephospho-CoA kinase